MSTPPPHGIFQGIQLKLKLGGGGEIKAMSGSSITIPGPTLALSHTSHQSHFPACDRPHSTVPPGNLPTAAPVHPAVLAHCEQGCAAPDQPWL